MTPVELLFILAVSLYVAFAAMDRWTRLRRPRPSHRQRIDPRKTWALEHELDLYADHPPERRLELLNHGPGCYRCSTIKPFPVGPAHLNGPIVEHRRFSMPGLTPAADATLRVCACRNITSNDSGVCGVCEVPLLAGPR